MILMDEIFERILLEEGQEALLIALVEAWRNLPREERRKFVFWQAMGGSGIIGLDDFPDPYKGDIEILGRADLLNVGYSSGGSLSFDITPLGFKYYEYLNRESGGPVQVVEERVVGFLESEYFRNRHPDAYAKWAQAMELLWSSDSQKELTAIGHHCREAMQYFATSLVDHHSPEGVTPEIDKTVKRVSAVLEQRSEALGEATKRVLKAFLAYWAALNGVVQRQEHGAQKEGQPLMWEDARRAVFHTAFAMFEIDTALQRTTKK
jgi:hypothetical protein